MKVMVLAAGRGERMRPLTDHTPKPLLEVGGKPLIMWMLERLARAGLTDVVINTAHLREQLHASLGDGAGLGVRINWSDEPAGALETAGGLRKALPLLGPGPFLAVAADVYCDAPFAELARVATQLRADADLAFLWLVPNPAHHVAGDFRLHGDRVLPAGEGALRRQGL
ncbi:MAG TPA: sugar phosphate nucleotidyltransferase, partial [Rhodocyclaceae bacterium]|nr:sugar phosphate nucleotidyltransferase [Rhodocyclaceae bacterium]